MLRTNLSARPFYNDRGVQAVIGTLALAALLLTLFNVYEVMQLRGESRNARDTISQNDAQAVALRQQAADIRRSIDRAKLASVQVAAREANALIDRRTFSWTELLNLFQKTLPADVRIVGVRPQLDDDGQRLVQISVISRRLEDVETFMAALEKTGAFSGVLSRAEEPDEGGSIHSALQAYYRPLTSDAAAVPVAASESGKAPSTNGSPAGVTAGNASPGAPR